MKSLVTVVVLLFAFVFLGSCNRKEGNLSFSLTPENLTLLSNTSTYTCLDKTKTPKVATATADAAIFRSLKISWKGTADLYVLAIRFTSNSSQLKSKIDLTLAGPDLAALVYTGDPNICVFCKIPKIATDQPNVVEIVDSQAYVDLVTKTTYKGCGPVIGGFKLSEEPVGEVVIPVKATLIGYSVGDNNTVNNEYATFNLNVRFQAPP